MTSLITPPEVAPVEETPVEDVAVRPARTVVRPGILPAPGPKQWVAACSLHVLVPGRGVAVLLPGGGQAALFLLPNGMIYAVDNIDPYSGAAVMSRGLTGDHGGEPTVASPLLKQVFSLRTGAALDDPDNPEVALPTYSVRVHHGVVRIGIPLP
ncbi:nitrite reductase small subunit NirD [Terrabacter sp. MAHUQ-38]|uniref:nitrite reductase small subunit NirD n=1 Tax=unclassified Terrabacter TaxID=2630222 RepID=UPI00165DC469|nr:nitrite reductase small subunit NirD [Terrabacter sp. MAHUQ-38]MBC9822064.1 nitrite reductase small subunit NirD [Terrabacter sp. MAHUQ-38]